MENKLVIVKHLNTPGMYLFKVPHGAYYLDAGQLVLCETKKGETLGIAACDAFEVKEENLAKICRLFNTEPEKLRFIAGKFSYDKYYMTDAERGVKEPEGTTEAEKDPCTATVDGKNCEASVADKPLE